MNQAASLLGWLGVICYAGKGKILGLKVTDDPEPKRAQVFDVVMAPRRPSDPFAPGERVVFENAGGEQEGLIVAVQPEGP